MFTAGVAYDGNKANFDQLPELGYLSAARGVVGVGAFADGIPGGNEDGVPFDTQVDLQSKTSTLSAYGYVTAQWRHNKKTSKWRMQLSD